MALKNILWDEIVLLVYFIVSLLPIFDIFQIIPLDIFNFYSIMELVS